MAFNISRAFRLRYKKQYRPIIQEKANAKNVPIDTFCSFRLIAAKYYHLSISPWAMRDSNSHGFPPHFECGASTNSANRPLVNAP